MLPLRLSRTRTKTLEILCLGAHGDDIEIGCGATILNLLAGFESTRVHWVVFSGSPERAREARTCAARFLRRANEKSVVVKEFRDGFLPYEGGVVKEEFESLKGEVSPDIIFTHHRRDLHQDHRLISELTLNTWRDHLILEYEIPKYDGDFGAPNLLVPISKTLARRKIDYIVKSFVSQTERGWFDEEVFWGILRLRGMEAKSPSGYAEAFYAHKIALG